MPSTPTLEQLLEGNFTLDVAPFPDAPLNEGDIVLYADRVSGRVLVARAPITVPTIAKPFGALSPTRRVSLLS